MAVHLKLYGITRSTENLPKNSEVSPQKNAQTHKAHKVWHMIVVGTSGEHVYGSKIKTLPLVIA